MVKKPVVKKPVVKKPVVKKPVVRKKLKVVPLASPSPKWPPKGFTSSSGIYAKIPSGTELIGIISAQKKLMPSLALCEKNACGAVLVASNTGCIWWEVDSFIYGPSTADPKIQAEYGTIRTTALGTKPKVVATILLISTEPLINGVFVKNVQAKCWPSAAPEKVPNNTYIPNDSH